MIRLENVLKISLQDVLKTSWRCLEDVFQEVLKTSWQDVLKMPWRRFEDVFKTSWRCLEDLFVRRLEEVLARRLEDVLKTSWRRRAKTNILVLSKTSWRRLHQDECLLGLFDKEGMTASRSCNWVCILDIFHKNNKTIHSIELKIENLKIYNKDVLHFHNDKVKFFFEIDAHFCMETFWINK